MARSIICNERECYLCREEAELQGYYGLLPSIGLHKHHIIFGTADRKKSEHWGVWCYLCVAHHEHGPEAVHTNIKTDTWLRQQAQRIFEARYSHELWMKEFGRNYI
jgi:hypothetical protein